MVASRQRRVLVTGNASGIGAAIAERLAGDGWAVTGVDRNPPSGGSSTIEQLSIDLSDPEQIRGLARSLSGVDAFVHAAGFMRVGSLEELDYADGDALWAVHVRALTLLAQGLCPGMPSGGRLVAIGSRTSAGAAKKSQYAATKAAVVGLVRSLAIELAPRGITANIVAPAATATPMLTGTDRGTVAPILPPIGRYIQPAEVAAYVSFLLSREAGAITGQELLICGGASL